MPATPTEARAMLSRRPGTGGPTPHPAGRVRSRRNGQARSAEWGTWTARKTRPAQKARPAHKQAAVQNRVRVLLVHIPMLSIRGQARLAAAVGVPRSTISRLVNGRVNPSYRLARGVTSALERFLGRPLDMREVFTTDGTYPTPSGCALCRCGGCLPDEAYDPDGSLRPEWRGRRPGDWSVSPSSAAPQSADPSGTGG